MGEFGVSGLFDNSGGVSERDLCGLAVIVGTEGRKGWVFCRLSGS